jgi:diamine N-acetyltransferase
MLNLREINRENYMECLRLTVAPAQRDFVASNAFSLAQAKYHPQCVPLAIYSDDVMVGFVMYCIDSDDDNYWVWRLMVDERHQRRGYGRRAMELVINRISEDKTRNQVLISFRPDNKVAENLYNSLGFVHTGRMIDGEVVVQLSW